MKLHTITFSRKLDRDALTYTIFAKDRDDAVDFVKRTHRLDFDKVISCRAVKPTKAEILREQFPTIETLVVRDTDPKDAVGYMTQRVTHTHGEN